MRPGDCVNKVICVCVCGAGDWRILCPYNMHYVWQFATLRRVCIQMILASLVETTKHKNPEFVCSSLTAKLLKLKLLHITARTFRNGTCPYKLLLLDIKEAERKRDGRKTHTHTSINKRFGLAVNRFVLDATRFFRWRSHTNCIFMTSWNEFD